MNEIKKKKLEKDFLKVIATLLIEGRVKDPRIEMMPTVHSVDLAEDLSEAKVYVTAYCNNNERKKILAGLRSASGFIQSQVSKALSLRITPKIFFFWDQNYLEGIRVNELIDSAKPKFLSDQKEF